MTDTHIDALRSDGHTCIRQVASEAEIEQWRPLVREVVHDHAEADRTRLQEDTFGRAFLQISNLWQLDERIRPFVLAPRFARIAAELLEVDAVRIYHDQAVFKHGGDGHTPLHQDQYYFPLDGDEIITMWMPLVPVPADVGSLRFASGSQRLGSLGNIDVDACSDADIEAVMADRGLDFETHGAMAPGDASFHTGWTVHGAARNPTESVREIMTVIYFADGLRGIAPEHEWHRLDYEAWLPGVEPGDLAASPINPVLWPV